MTGLGGCPQSVGHDPGEDVGEWCVSMGVVVEPKCATGLRGQGGTGSRLGTE